MMGTVLRSLFVATATLLSTPALAHSGHEVSGLLAGVMHPLLGLDHLLVMLAVGVWAVRQPHADALALPFTFVLMMVAGALSAMAGWQLPATEVLIAVSVIALGGVLVWAPQLSFSLTLTVVAGFAFFHGQAHGAELPQAASAGLYVLGFALMTLLLHLGGMALAGRLQERLWPWLGLGMSGAGVLALL
ncbi:HupE/UreJ family protein [Balneatrix alpica]|uniref:HupE/UreJ family protein n=1 Tax=Balneatrix alpica TaxID=75684 RepID=UPI002739EF37|nr:HupE/UreJ family protein [Balneatrix alpica]